MNVLVLLPVTLYFTPHVAICAVVTHGLLDDEIVTIKFKGFLITYAFASFSNYQSELIIWLSDIGVVEIDHFHCFTIYHQFLEAAEDVGI